MSNEQEGCLGCSGCLAIIALVWVLGLVISGLEYYASQWSVAGLIVGGLVGAPVGAVCGILVGIAAGQSRDKAKLGPLPLF